MIIEPAEVAPGFLAEQIRERIGEFLITDENVPQSASYGFWRSPITAELVAQAGLRFGEVRPAVAGVVYWGEGRPKEGGRNVIVRRDALGVRRDITPVGFNARTRVHEYGGGAFLVWADGSSSGETVVFSHFGDDRLYRQVVTPTGVISAPVPVTPDDGSGPERRRYADMTIDSKRGRLLAVCEDHRFTNSDNAQPKNYLVVITLSPGESGPGEPEIIASGHDFYSSPRLSADGGSLCFLAWDHPSMPWFGCTLYVAPVAEDGLVGDAHAIAGGTEEAIFQPEWGPLSGAVYFVSDRDTGWWNLYRCSHPLSDSPAIERITAPIEAEFAAPQWNFGMCLYDFIPDYKSGKEELVCAFTSGGRWRLARVKPEAHETTLLDSGPFTDLSQVRATSVTDGAPAVLFIGGGPSTPTAIVRKMLDGDTVDSNLFEVLHAGEPLPPEILRCISDPTPITFPTVGAREAFALYYPPRHPDYVAPDGELPPILVKGHGGPTAAASIRLSLGFQYWTSRGIGVLDVNYGGSTGYGREYRSRLYREWGVVDVEDCVAAAKYLVQAGKADGQRLLISGGSAGGYTALRAITFRPGVFAAAASFYGIGDLESLARDTHKFESRYLDWLIGPYPDDQQTYRDRSPIHHIDSLSVPVAFFQGGMDRIVPPNQAEAMVNALRGKKIAVGYFLFEQEGHGFRNGTNIVRATDGELYFYSFTVLGTGLRF